MTDYKTPISKVRGLGSAKDGTEHWWMQRITAVFNLFLTIFFVVSVVGNAGKSYLDWLAWLQQPVVAVLMILYVINLFYHLRLGLTILVSDYIHKHSTKNTLLILATAGTVLLGSLSVFSILRVALGG